ncbi:helix-turn-helix domain-containing protein [Epilithonimonas sp.]|uniref:helix-turn-helix domain-containing protein n=1 Tax=Epilithonimonas sp. TaxID=2894511 RepID=UPI0035B43077
MRFLKYLYSLFFLVFIQIGAQKNNFDNLSYETIEKKIDQSENDPDKIWDLIRYYIKKAKSEKRNEPLVYAYRYASNYSKYPNSLLYADSALIVSRNSDNPKLLANAYLNRGIIYMNGFHYQKALDDILIANKYSKELNDDYIIYKTIYFIAQNKIYLGLYDEANKELEKCIKFFKENINSSASLGKDYQTYYIFSLMSYIDSNTQLGKSKQNQKLIKEGLTYLKENNLLQYIPYFISLEGTDAFFNKDYKKASAKLSQALQQYNDQWPHITEIYYLGLTNWKLGNHSVAVKYLENIDKEYDKTNQLDPQFRSAYEILIKYNDSLGNTKKQLEYINKLMHLDDSYEKNYKYLYPKINKEYDSKKLLEEKQSIENMLKLQKRAFYLALVVFILLLTYFLIRYYRLKKIYKQRFEDLLRKNEAKDSLITIAKQEESLDQIFVLNDNDYFKKIPGLNPNIVKNILSKIDEFEAEKKFLNPQVSQKTLSESFGTNSTYFSKIINTYKNKNFNIYINDLRLDYILELMKSDSKYIHMDVKELANLSGFMNAENFSDNFHRKFKIKPSYFIKMMKENTTISSQ